MPTVVFIGPDGRSQAAEAPEGGSLAQLCDAADSPVPFHCRRGNCGTCRVEVLQGAGQLLPPQAPELRLLALLGLPPERHRLACQAQMQAGGAELRLRPLGRKAPRHPSVRVPVEFGPDAMRVPALATGAEDILVTGADRLDSGTVILFDFRPPGAPQRRQVMARVSAIEPLGTTPEGHERALVAAELLEDDDLLVSLLPAAALFD